MALIIHYTQIKIYKGEFVAGYSAKYEECGIGYHVLGPS